MEVTNYTQPSYVYRPSPSRPSRGMAAVVRQYTAVQLHTAVCSCMYTAVCARAQTYSIQLYTAREVYWVPSGRHRVSVPHRRRQDEAQAIRASLQSVNSSLSELRTMLPPPPSPSPQEAGEAADAESVPFVPAGGGATVSLRLGGGGGGGGDQAAARRAKRRADRRAPGLRVLTKVRKTPRCL
jgi:hypothetical protein